MNVRGCVWAAALMAASGCFSSNNDDTVVGDGGVVGSGDGSSGGQTAGKGGSGGQSAGGGGPTGGPSCLFSDVTAELSVTNVDKIDLLFVVDNSGSMREEQVALRAQFPKLIQVLTTGDRDGDGIGDFPPAKDLHLGVVSSDMGLVGISGIPGCEGLGDDGIMNNVPGVNVQGCQAAYPRFLSYTAGVNDPNQTATDFSCVADLGTDGCGFEQQLEAGLKALWPSNYIDPQTGQVADNPIKFLGDINGFGELGHGDVENNGFLRNDPVQGISLVAIIVVSDEEDCSSADTRHFTPQAYLPEGDPLRDQDLNLRCFYNPGNLYVLDRYVNGFKALRPGNENLVVFGAIVGVPVDLVDPDAIRSVDFADEPQRDSFYEGILADPRMQEVPDPNRTAEQGGNLTPSCITDTGRAFPPRRIVEVARRFGENGIVQSICQSDLGPATDAIVAVISRQLGAVCLPRELVRDAKGLVSQCEVSWELPPPSAAPASTPVSCDERDYLSTPTDGPSTTARGGQICRVAQLAVVDNEFVPTDGANDGWYYDDFSDDVQHECSSGALQRVAFTPSARPPTGVTVKLQCGSTQSSSGAADQCESADGVGSPQVGAACLPDSVPEAGFDDREAYIQSADTDCDGGACLVFRLRGDPRDDCTPAPVSCDPSDPSCAVDAPCADPSEVQARVYCSCRCSGPGDGEFCACPDGFSCVDVAAQAPEGIAGGYCVKNGTFSR